MLNAHPLKDIWVASRFGPPSLCRSCQCDDFFLPFLGGQCVAIFRSQYPRLVGWRFLMSGTCIIAFISRYKRKYSCGEVLNLRCWGLRSIVHVDGARRDQSLQVRSTEEETELGTTWSSRARHVPSKDNPLSPPPSFRPHILVSADSPTPTTLFFSCSRLKSLQGKKLHKNYN